MISADDISGAFESIDHELVCYVLDKMMGSTTYYKLAKFLDSYLDRKAFGVEEGDNNVLVKIEIVRKFLKKTTPQGSLLSPLLWRIYDNLFTELYKENLEAVVIEYDDILMISHVSYADDHLTVISFLVDKTQSDEVTGERMCALLCLVRDLIVDATVQLGCGVNPLKSENIVPSKFSQYIDLNFENLDVEDDGCFKGKDTFKWLGYFLTLDDHSQLKFNQRKIEDHLKYLTTCRNQIFLYTDSISVKWRIYKVFFCPFIELYLPVVIQSKIFNNTALHKFQHSSICAALGLPITASRRNLEVKLGEEVY